MERPAPGGRERFSWDGWKNLLLPQLNRQSLYVYGSEVAVERDSNSCLFRSYYTMCMVAITFLNLIGIPIEIAFLDGQTGVGWEGFNVFSDTLFLIDVGLNFRMGIIAEDSEAAILDLKCIRQNYLKSWFIPDVIAAFPVGYIILIDLQYHSDSPSSKASKMVRILMFVRILSLVRLLRVSRLVRFFNEVSNANLEVVRVFFRILSLFMMIFLLCHWNGCVQYFVPMLEEFPSDCWVRRENLMVLMGEKYSFGIFRALSHMTAISYGSSETPTISYVFFFLFLLKVPMFKNCDVNFISSIVSELQYEVFQEGDIIMCQNTPGDRMFFIEHGQVVVETDSFQQELCDGDYFGETCLLIRGRRLSTVQAQTICQLFSLCVDSFYRVLRDYPEVMTDIYREHLSRE
uniref:Cyclic nucleotide-binding domain-containing protein n=1 Tax=Pygocentrus nattereri TaxID=42514 RepID=A0A3B4DQ47_PYGNA